MVDVKSLYVTMYSKCSFTSSDRVLIKLYVDIPDFLLILLHDKVETISVTVNKSRIYDDTQTLSGLSLLAH